MATISNLSCDLLEEILSRVPITSLGAVRSICKRWNTLSKSRLLCKAQVNHQFLGFMRKNLKLCSLRFHLHEKEEFSVKEISNQVERISGVHVCDGLLLCVTVTMDTLQSLMVWNPYLGQTRWIEPSSDYDFSDIYALGYDDNRNLKILRYYRGFGDEEECEIYDLKSDSWRTLDVTLNWGRRRFHFSASLKGNTYFTDYDFILCFDFTRERFGEKLPLPWSQDHTSNHREFTPISCFGEEKLAALYRGSPIFAMEIWVTTKIEPDEVLWSNLFTVDLLAISPVTAHSFFIDEEKKRAVIFARDSSYDKESFNAAYIVGENDFFKTVNLGEINSYFPLVSSNSYVPSLVQIKQN